MIPPIQLAIQGGGAKLPHLIAAATAFQELHNSGEIRLTRVAGTSSGALVAAFLAGGLQLPEVIQFLNKHGPRHKKQVMGQFSSGFGFFNRKYAMLKAAFGFSILDAVQLRAFIESIFQELTGSIPDTISSVENATNIKLLITASDISRHRGHIFGSSESLMDSLVHSCSFPFAFRNYKAIANTSYVDGGLCDNLPAEHLVEGAREHGHVFAISPEERAAPCKNVNNVIAYVNSLFSASINHDVLRNKKVVGKSSLIDFKSDIDTFSFEEAVSIKTSDETYLKIRNMSRNKILDYIELCGLIRGTSTESYDHILDIGVVDAPDLMRSVYQLYKMMSPVTRSLPIKSSMIAMIDSLGGAREGGGNRSDIVIHRYCFKTGNDPIRTLFVNAVSDGTMLAVKPLRWFIKNTRTGDMLKATIIPSLNDDANDGKSHMGFCIFFENPISSGNSDDEFLFQYQYASQGSFGGLASKSASDFLAIQNLQGGSVPVVDLIIAIPFNFNRRIAPSVSNNKIQWSELNQEQINEYDICSHARYNSYGVRIKNLPSGIRIQADFTVC